MNKQPGDDIAEQETQQLPIDGLTSARSFAAYLQAHRLVALNVATTAGVRALTIWNIEHGIPISAAHAVLVRTGLRKLTGIAYTAPILIHYETPSPQRALRTSSMKGSVSREH